MQMLYFSVMYNKEGLPKGKTVILELALFCSYFKYSATDILLSIF
jgi:hypothetical protein